MDPDQAWVDLSQAVAEGRWQRAAEIAEDLLDWLVKDGCPPTITTMREFDVVAARATCEAIATWEVA